MEGEVLVPEPSAPPAPATKIAPIPDGYRSSDDGKYTSVSNFKNDEDTEAEKKADADVKDAASKLGKKGGRASAEKREAEGKEKADSPKEAKDDSGRAGKAARGGANEPEVGDGEGDAEAGGSADEKPLGKPDRDPRARVAEATRKAKEAEERAYRAEQRAQRVEWERQQEREQRERASQPDQPKQPDRSVRPKLEDYESYDQYTEALTDWKVEQKFQGIQEQQEVQAQVQTWGERLKTGLQSFEKVMTEADEADPEWSHRIDPHLLEAWEPAAFVPKDRPIMPRNVIFQEIHDSPMAPSLLLYFSDDNGKKEFSRIARLRTPREISMELARLEERLRPATAGTRPETSVSKAPLPFQPVKGAPHTGERYRDEDSYDSYRASAKKSASR